MKQDRTTWQPPNQGGPEHLRTGPNVTEVRPSSAPRPATQPRRLTWKRIYPPLVTFLVIAGLAVGIVAGLGSLGPVHMVPTTQAEVTEMCTEQVLAQVPNPDSAHLNDLDAFRAHAGWTVRGNIEFPNLNDHWMTRDFECLVERIHGTIGTSVTWLGFATPMDPQPDR